MIASGIVDPAKVTRSALENAASVSGMVLTTESLAVSYTHLFMRCALCPQAQISSAVP